MQQLLASVLYLVAHEVFALAVLCIQSAGNKCIHLLLVSRRNAVPDLQRTVVKVIKAVQFHVFSVPEQHTLAGDYGQCSACPQGMGVHIIHMMDLLTQKHTSVQPEATSQRNCCTLRCSVQGDLAIIAH